MQVTGLPSGTYRVIIEEPYRDPAGSPFVFDLDLTGPTSGSVCDERDYYPGEL
jgi:hypothetical protein